MCIAAREHSDKISVVLLRETTKPPAALIDMSLVASATDARTVHCTCCSTLKAMAYQL
jgi:hypothetical protein